MPNSNCHGVNGQPIVPFREGVWELEGVARELPASDDLRGAFSRVWQEIGGGPKVDFRVVVEGESRRLHPQVKDQAYWIGREALQNALRHAAASEIEMVLEYGPDRLRIAVRDNGKGISPNLFHSPGNSHRGLSWMRHLAEGMGARLKLLSRVATGTEVELSIPGHIAFGSQRGFLRLGWAHLCSWAA